MFSFSYDPARVLLSIVQQGYWTVEMFREFANEFLRQHAKIRAQHKNYRVLADCLNFPVQSTEIGEAAAAFFKELLLDNQGRYAIVAASMLNKMQAKRAIPQHNVQMFLDMEEAKRWLFAEGSLPD